MIKVPIDVLVEYEESLDPSRKISSKYRMDILGYGEISTVIRINAEELQNIALKRIPGFSSLEEASGYAKLYVEYNELLRKAGINIPEYGYAIIERSDKIYVLYLAQELLPRESICNNAIRKMKIDDALYLIEEVVLETSKIWKWNLDNPYKILGIDGQISNWALPGEEHGRDLLYLDSSTPMIRENNRDLLNTEVFLRSAPPIIRTLLKRLYLQQILDRYYDPRSVIVDLVANLIKEGRRDLIKYAVARVNNMLKTELAWLEIEPLTLKEIETYYKEDARIWTIYLSARKLHRRILTLLGKRYDYLLPDEIKRY